MPTIGAQQRRDGVLVYTDGKDEYGFEDFVHLPQIIVFESIRVQIYSIKKQTNQDDVLDRNMDGFM